MKHVAWFYLQIHAQHCCSMFKQFVMGKLGKSRKMEDIPPLVLVNEFRAMIFTTCYTLIFPYANQY